MDDEECQKANRSDAEIFQKISLFYTVPLKRKGTAQSLKALESTPSMKAGTNERGQRNAANTQSLVVKAVRREKDQIKEAKKEKDKDRDDRVKANRKQERKEDMMEEGSVEGIVPQEKSLKEEHEMEDVGKEKLVLHEVQKINIEGVEVEGVKGTESDSAEKSESDACDSQNEEEDDALVRLVEEAQEGAVQEHRDMDGERIDQGVVEAVVRTKKDLEAEVEETEDMVETIMKTQVQVCSALSGKQRKFVEDMLVRQYPSSPTLWDYLCEQAWQKAQQKVCS